MNDICAPDIRWRLPRVPRALIPWLVPLGLLLMWELLTSGGVVPARKLPSPHAVLLAGWGGLLRDVLVSTGRAATGLVIGGSLGFCVGLAAGISRLAEHLFDGALQMLRMVPHLALLDSLTRLEMQSLIETLWQRAGFTAVLVTHDVAEAAILADRILLIEDGGIAMDLAVTLPRPRRTGAALAEIEAAVLGRLLGR